MICKNCGNENADGTKFCRFCGTALSTEEVAPVVPPQPIVPPQPMGTPMNTMQGGMPNNGVNPMQSDMNPAQSGMNPMGAPMQGGMPNNGMNPIQNGARPMGAPMPGTAMPMNNGMPNNGMPNNGMPGGGIPVGNPGGIPVGRPVSMPYQPGVVPPANPQKKSGNGAKVVIILLILLILIGIGVIVAIFATKAMDSKKVNDKVAAAQELFDEGEYADAVDVYLEALEMKEDNADAINGLTDAYLAWADEMVADGDYEGALELLEDAKSEGYVKPKKIKEAITEIEVMMATPDTAGGDGFSSDDLYFTGSDNIYVETDHSIIVYEDVTYYTDYATGDYEEMEEEFTTARGLALGMTMEDYLNMYNVTPGYAAWELFSGDNNEYTSFSPYYDGDTAEDFLSGEYNTVWLDIGFSLEDGYWRQMEDWEIQDTWFCDADLYDYEEVIVFAVCIDDWGTVTGISLEHFTYDEGWVEWQGWAE